MMFMFRARTLITAAAAVAVLSLGGGQAQAQPSGWNSAESFFGITRTLVSSTATSKTYKYELGALGSASFVSGGDTYYVNAVLGVFEVYIPPITPKNNSGTTAAGWVKFEAPNNNNGPWDATGYEGTGGDERILNGQERHDFTWDDLTDYEGSIGLGYHLQYFTTPGETSGAVLTKRFYEGGGNPLPEPAFYQMSGLLLLGGAGIFLRSRRAKKNAA